MFLEKICTVVIFDSYGADSLDLQKFYRLNFILYLKKFVMQLLRKAIVTLKQIITLTFGNYRFPDKP